MISIIICSADSVKYANTTRRYGQLLQSEPHEIIRISDATSLAEGYNRGFAQSTGDIIIFSHDDVYFLATDFAARLKEHMATYDAIGVCGTNKVVGPSWIDAGHPHVFGQVAHPVANNTFTICIYGAPLRAIDRMQAMDGCFLAFRREVISQIQWDEDTFDDFFCYDVDTTFRAYRAGFNLAVVNDLHVVHGSGGDFTGKWRQYARRFVDKHRIHLDEENFPKFSYANLQVRSEIRVVEAMSPTYWRDEQIRKATFPPEPRK